MRRAPSPVLLSTARPLRPAARGIAPIRNVISVDVEEFYHATIFQEATAVQSLPRESRVEPAIERILHLFADHDTRATFFVLGSVAAMHTGMVRQIAGLGHEIACHGYAHDLVSSQTPGTFRRDVQTAKRVLEDIVGQPVLGYRAPSFSIGPEQSWAYGTLMDEGFVYDSSAYPILHDRYGQRTAPRFPHIVARERGRHLIEFPIGTARCCGVNLPIGGGGWFRLLPISWVRRGIQRVNRVDTRPSMFFFHPWELDPDLPRPRMAWHHRFRLTVGLSRSEAKLRVLLRALRFTTAREALASLGLLTDQATMKAA